MIGEILLWAATALAALAAAWDVAQRRIPNWSVLALGALALASTVTGGGWTPAGSAAAHAVIALLVGMVLFRVAVIGAGDAKLYAAAALAIPLDDALLMLGYTALVGVVLWIVLFLGHRGFKRRNSNGEKLSWTLPYGAPIAVAFFLTTRSDLWL